MPEWWVMPRLDLTPNWASLSGGFVQCTTYTTIQSHPETALSGPSGKKSYPLSGAEETKGRMNLIASDSLDPMYHMFRVTGIQTTWFWPQSSNLLHKEVISVSQSLMFLTTGCFLPVVLLAECVCKGWAETRAGKAFESQPAGNLKTKGLQTDIICNSGLSSC